MVNILISCCGPVFRNDSYDGHEPGTLAEAESTPGTSKPMPQEVSCSDEKGQGPCFQMVSTGGSNDSLLLAASYNSTSSSSGVAPHGSKQLGDAYGSPAFASSLKSSPSVNGSNLVQNLQSVVTDKSAEYDPSTSRIVSYGSIYRLRKPHGVYSSSRTAVSPSYKPTVSSPVTSTTGQNGNIAGSSQVSNDTTQSGNAYNSGAATYSRNRLFLGSTVISSSPMIIYIRPNQSDHQLEQPISKGQSNDQTGAPIKSLMTANQPFADQPTAENSKPYQRLTSQAQVPILIRYQSPPTDDKPMTVPKPHVTSTNPSTLQLSTIEPRFTHLGKTHSAADPNYKPFGVFKPAQTTYMGQISKPVQSSQQLADFSQDPVYDPSSTAVPLTGSVPRFTRPAHGTSVSAGTSMYEPSSSAKTEHGMQHFYQTGLSFSKVSSGKTRYGLAQSGNGYSATDDAYTSNSQPTFSSFNLSQNPYFVARHGQRSHSMFTPLQPNYKSYPTRYMQMPSKSFNTPFSKKDSVYYSEQLKQMVSGPVQISNQSKHPHKPIQSRPYKSTNLSDYMSSLLLPAKQPATSNYNKLQTGQSESVNPTNYNPIQRMYSSSKSIQSSYNPPPLLVSQGSVGRLARGYVVDQTSNQSGVPAKPSQQFVMPLSSSLSSPESWPASWYRPSRPDLGFALKGSGPVLNFQKSLLTRTL